MNESDYDKPDARRSRMFRALRMGMRPRPRPDQIVTLQQADGEIVAIRVNLSAPPSDKLTDITSSSNSSR